MRSRTTRLLLCCAGILLLRQSLLWLDNNLDIRHQQNALLHHHDIEPAALFYSELPAALAAEKTLRQRLQQQRESH